MQRNLHNTRALTAITLNNEEKNKNGRSVMLKISSLKHANKRQCAPAVHPRF